MHIATIALWPLSVLAAALIGGLAGLLLAVVKGGELAHTYARHLDRTSADDAASTADEQDDAADTEDEESRLDALTVRALIRAARDVAINEDALRQLRLGETTALHKALSAAEGRFADWIEWAEGAHETDADEENVYSWGWAVWTEDRRELVGTVYGADLIDEEAALRQFTTNTCDFQHTKANSWLERVDLARMDALGEWDALSEAEKQQLRPITDGAAV